MGTARFIRVWYILRGLQDVLTIVQDYEVQFLRLLESPAHYQVGQGSGSSSLPSHNCYEMDSALREF